MAAALRDAAVEPRGGADAAGCAVGAPVAKASEVASERAWRGQALQFHQLGYGERRVLQRPPQSGPKTKRTSAAPLVAELPRSFTVTRFRPSVGFGLGRGPRPR